jgi:hypothetical protein
MQAMSNDVRSALEEFVRAGLESLLDAGVIPRSRYEPWLRAGQSYEGSLLMSLRQYGAASAALEAAYPDRFEDQAITSQESTAAYLFGLIEGIVARLTSRGQSVDLRSPAVQQSIDELIAGLPGNSVPVRVVHILEGLLVPGDPISIGTVEFHRSEGQTSYQIDTLIPGSGQSVREHHGIYLPKRTCLAIMDTDRGEGLDHSWGAADSAINDCIMGLRLASAGTVVNRAVVYGQPTAIRAYSPWSDENPFVGDFPIGERLVSLSGALASSVAGLLGWYEQLTSDPKGATPSLLVAIDRYGSSYLGRSWRDVVIDLAIGLEAALIGTSDDEGISLRLKLRSALLLSTDGDDERTIYKDVGELYGLRSSLVHGTAIKPRLLEKLPTRVLAGRRSHFPGEQLVLIEDRWRDLLRRAILARLCLGLAPSPLWGWRGTEPQVDSILLDSELRAVWRARVRDRLATIGLESAIEPPPPMTGIIGIERPDRTSAKT